MTVVVSSFLSPSLTPFFPPSRDGSSSCTYLDTTETRRSVRGNGKSRVGNRDYSRRRTLRFTKDPFSTTIVLVEPRLGSTFGVGLETNLIFGGSSRNSHATNLNGSQEDLERSHGLLSLLSV